MKLGEVPGGRPLRNTYAAIQPDDPKSLRRLFTSATQDGHVIGAERAFLANIPLPPALRSTRDQFLANPKSPEIKEARKLDPAFAKRLKALEETAKPGDLLIWRSSEASGPWGLMKKGLGPWLHASVVLDDGRLMDPHWPDGAAICTKEAALARGVCRVGPAEILVSRPEAALSQTQIKQLSNLARTQEGRAFRLVSSLGKANSGVSCARMAWELFHSLGIDLAPASRRLFRSFVSPEDLIEKQIALISKKGVAGPAPEGLVTHRLPDGIHSGIARGLDWIASKLPSLLSGTIKLQDRIINALMKQSLRRLPG